MELILKQDVENLGFKDDVVTVKNGYGRNFLIPQGQAIMATISAKKVLAETLKQREYKEKTVIAEAQKTADALKQLDIKITSKAGTGATAGDKLFGSITNMDLSHALKQQGHEVDKKFISINGGNIKRLGQYEAVIRLHRAVTVDMIFEVIADA
ncbi:50S ribosomal protein L9 [Subsaximicrobium wynnwilliamsii]|uniref:Large ribosomal subunit protein bL9 n=1 Tax=Subsaximicrobium wynnwilliamsii TaxID=291179 RepID=A0A5C6ZNG4_9FLAO|nr:50S ribosomal protein L9 [Subsaximicrobium wynnwilliamsii]TXD81635.1 50S ribosomal protein L9 [Subsaximicrobium wynnwilliamsii]TXD91037.1 50S ribosomal protein L9 [Subsaximicrobium wynnwilliamsii]TXE01084.1 50S ribosomal protein L9 [Subsaximicrobium wynnwilliamsii]